MYQVSKRFDHSNCIPKRVPEQLTEAFTFPQASVQNDVPRYFQLLNLHGILKQLAQY